MKTKLIAFFMCIVTVTLTFSGCNLKISAPETLMSPPRLTGDYQALQDSFEAQVGSNVALIAPAYGEHKSAFVIDDFNSDSIQEAMVFYSVKEKDETVSVGIFQKKAEKWEYIKSVAGIGSSIDTVIIEDINSDKVKEVIIGWSLYTLNKQVSVYEPDLSSPNVFINLGSFPYNLLEMIDVNQNGKKELFLVNLDTTGIVPGAKAEVYTVSKDVKIENLSSISIDGNVSGYSKIAVEKSGYIYVDAFKNEHDMITEVLVWNKNKNALEAPLFDMDTQTTTATWRNQRIPVSDIDNDGNFEIPVGVEMTGSTQVKSGVLQDESIYYTCWSSFNANRLKAEKYCLYNFNEGYRFDVPSSWVGKITINSLDSQWYFYRWNQSASEHMGDLMFTIVSHATDTQALEGYSRLTQYEDKAFEYLITNSGKAFGVNSDHFEKGFSIETQFTGGK